MKNIIPFNKVYPIAHVLTLSMCLLSFSVPVNADSRSEAREALQELRKNTSILKMPDELASIETTFSVAEQYHKQSHRELSEQYYLLTIQKARILKSNYVGTATAVVAGKNPALLEASATNISATPVLPAQTASAALITTAPVSKITSITGQNIPSEQLSEPKKNDTLPTADSDDSDENEDDFLSDAIASEYLVGNPSVYSVKKNENLRLIAAKLGVTRQHLMEVNGLNSKSVLKAGQQLKYNNRKIIPQQVKNGIIINIPEKTLYYFRAGKLTRSIPVALGVATKNKKFDWQTPTGKFKIISKQKDPTWYVPPSIQEEMEDEGKEVITSIPPGPTNPLGKYAFKTTLPGILIHSTIRPASIYSFASHGCIRVYPQHMEEFFNEVKVNTPGEIIYRPVKLVNTETGRIFLEVHHDVYGKSSELTQVAKQLIEKQKLSNRVNWQKVRSVIKQKAGIAEDITL